MRICGTKSKHVISDCELGWKRKQLVQNPSFSINSGKNSNSYITEYSSPFGIFQVISDSGMFKILCDKTKIYATQKINKKKKDGPLRPK
jgi:hypothetical protein